MVLLRNKDQQ